MGKAIVVNDHACMNKSAYRRNIILLYLISTLNGMQFITPVLIRFFLFWGSLSFSQIMGLQSIFYIAVVLTEIPLGMIADLISKRLSISLSLCFSLLAIIFYSIIPKFHMFIIAELLWACAGSLISGADSALLHDTLVKLDRESDVAAIYGRYDSCRLIGFLIASPLGSIFAITLGLRLTMQIMVVPVGIAALLSCLIYEPSHNAMHRIKYIELMISGFKTIWSQKNLRILYVDSLIVTSLCIHLMFTYQQRLLELSINPIHYGWILMVFLGSSITLQTAQKWLVKFLRKKKRLQFIMMIGAGLGLIIMGTANSLMTVVFGISLIAGCGLPYYRISLAYSQIYISSQERSTVISTMNMIRLLLLSGINALVGYFAEFDLGMLLLSFGLILLLWAILSPVREHHLEKMQIEKMKHIEQL